MQKQVWKFPLDATDEQIVAMPKGAEILCAQMQGPRICIWALVSVDSRNAKRRIFVRGTGHNASGLTADIYVGTVMIASGRVVLHVFDGGEIVD